ncbi:tectonin domain-containing protein [Adonisia turfae]|uniref:M23 family peptidase n=1 Tax=Adonisia turfae CCMR0081 TaxID=2292702 RepID=A0A6M0RD90_9CYAN|nr:tectonin domain-containing protein [Adonisia turfae]NEZ54196.1 M23 family peptidase [Adonisia turfae CCMR0081]
MKLPRKLKILAIAASSIALTLAFSVWSNQTNHALANQNWKLPWPASVPGTVERGALSNHYDGYVGNGQSIDFDIPAGTPVLAPVDSQIMDQCNAGNNHWAIKLQALSSNQIYSLIHVFADNNAVQRGKIYRQGQQIGIVASDRPSHGCATSTGPHLHMGLPSVPFTLDGYTFTTDNPYPSGTFRSTNTAGGKIFQRVNNGWSLRPGIGHDIASSNGHHWLIGANSVHGGYGIYQWNGNDWNVTDGGAVGIAVSPSGKPWVINNEDYIYRRENNTWQQLPGRAKDIDISENGHVWIIGANEVNGGYPIWYWHGTDWTPIDGGAVRIAVDPSGSPWIVNNEGYIYRRVNDAWQLLPGRAKDIDIGGDGSVWIVGTNEVTGGYGIYQWNGSNWDVKDGGAVRIAVDEDGNPWVVNNGK